MGQKAFTLIEVVIILVIAGNICSCQVPQSSSANLQSD